MHPGQWPSRPVNQWIVAEGGRVESKRAERRHHATVVEEASLIVDVVSDPWCQHVQPADGANDLAFRVDLEVMDEGVVLKHHRQARIVAKQCAAQFGPGPRESPYCDTGSGLPCHADFNGGRAVSLVDGLPTLQKMGAGV